MRWLAAGPGQERVKLAPDLRAYLHRYPEDERAALVRIYLAWIEIQQGRLAEARALVAPARGGPAGTAQDFAVVTDAAILIRQGKPGQALSLLRPLDGKIIDADQRMIYGEQLVLAAIGAQALAQHGRRTCSTGWRRRRPRIAKRSRRTSTICSIRCRRARSRAAWADLDQEGDRSAAPRLVARAGARLAPQVAARAAGAACARASATRRWPSACSSSGPAALRAGEQWRAAVAARRAAARCVRASPDGRWGWCSAGQRRRAAAIGRGGRGHVARAGAAGVGEPKPGAVRLVTRDDGGESGRHGARAVAAGG